MPYTLRLTSHTIVGQYEDSPNLIGGVSVQSDSRRIVANVPENTL